ncbi:MAG: monofunctional biosynthetic peptidoglycan transglycosylase [Alistipes sp.]|nr:monofunctional biosynthetic peptidoglycan transglycosylase [Alistipes sp.]
MKYIGRLVLYLLIFFTVASVGCVVVFRFIPPVVTPYKAVQSWQQGRYFAGPRAKWRGLDKIAVYLPRTVIATEDNNFMTHHGFDFEAIRQAMDERRESGRVRGASTISQQTAKNVFCTPAGSWFRKGVESYFTVLIETLWNKRRIMEVYLNVIETGPGVYGAQATARWYFGKDASELSQADASLIATVLPNPLRMNLADPSSYMRRRASQVSSLMNKVPAPEF